MRLLTGLKTFSKKVLILSVFYIQEFYPLMKEKLLKDNLAFAQKYVEIKQNKLDLIFHMQKSLLYSKDTMWIKKEKEMENLMLQWGAMTELRCANL